MVRRGCGRWPQQVTVDHASCHRECRGGARSGWLLVFFHRLVHVLPEIGSPDRGRADRFDPARSRCHDLPRAWLQDAVFGLGARRKLYRDLHTGQVPAADGAGAGHQYSRRLFHSGIDFGRPQPGGGRTPASGAAAEARPQADAPEEAKTQACCCARGRIAVPGTGSCGAPLGARRIVPGSHHA